MSTKIWLSTHARPLDPEDATISVFDRGFLYGDSVYETLRTAGGRIVQLEAHLDRLRRSAEGIAFELPFDAQAISAVMRETIVAAANPESRIRVIVTRGTGPISLDTRAAREPLLAIIVSALEVPSAEIRERGISAVVVGREGTVRPGLKTGNYLGNILAVRAAHEQGADDAILCNADGAVAEGATSNLFMVAGGEVSTPSLATGLLAGITRGTVMELLERELGLSVSARTILVEELERADELFLTSSIRGVMPVTMLDGETVGGGRAGAVTRRVIEAHERFLKG